MWGVGCGVWGVGCGVWVWVWVWVWEHVFGCVGCACSSSRPRGRADVSCAACPYLCALFPGGPCPKPLRAVSMRYLGVGAIVCKTTWRLRDPSSFKSVHLLNEQLKREMEEERKREEEEWRSKVVVDSLRFQPVFGYKKPGQVRALWSAPLVLGRGFACRAVVRAGYLDARPACMSRPCALYRDHVCGCVSAMLGVRDGVRVCVPWCACGGDC